MFNCGTRSFSGFSNREAFRIFDEVYSHVGGKTILSYLNLSSRDFNLDDVNVSEDGTRLDFTYDLDEDSSTWFYLGYLSTKQKGLDEAYARVILGVSIDLHGIQEFSDSIFKSGSVRARFTIDLGGDSWFILDAFSNNGIQGNFSISR